MPITFFATLNRIQHFIHLVGVIQHQYNVPKLGKLRMPPHLQRPGSLSGSFHLHEAHPAARQQHQPVGSSRPTLRCELQAKTTTIRGGLAKLQFYLTFSDDYHAPHTLLSTLVGFRGKGTGTSRRCSRLFLPLFLIRGSPVQRGLARAISIIIDIFFNRDYARFQVFEFWEVLGRKKKPKRSLGEELCSFVPRRFPYLLYLAEERALEQRGNDYELFFSYTLCFP